MWHKLAKEAITGEQDLNKDGSETAELLGFLECGQDDAKASLNSDAAVPGYQVLSEEEVVQDEECVNQDDSDDDEREASPLTWKTSLHLKLQRFGVSSSLSAVLQRYFL